MGRNKKARVLPFNSILDLCCISYTVPPASSRMPFNSILDLLEIASSIVFSIYQYNFQFYFRSFPGFSLSPTISVYLLTFNSILDLSSLFSLTTPFTTPFQFYFRSFLLATYRLIQQENYGSFNSILDLS